MRQGCLFTLLAILVACASPKKEGEEVTARGVEEEEVQTRGVARRAKGIDLGRVLYAGKPARKSRPRPSARPAGRAPKPLTREQRNRVALHLRGLAQRSKVGTRGFGDYGAKLAVRRNPWDTGRVRLTPSQPRLGRNRLSVGHCGYRVDEDSATDWIHLHRYDYYRHKHQGSMTLYFSTLVGKTYMLDLAVGSGDWMLSGMINQPSIVPQDGHLLLGFTATETSHSLTLRKQNRERDGYFYYCEFYPVD